MAIGFTNRGKLRALEAFLQDKPLTGFFIALVKPTPAPTPDTNTFGELDEIASGNGYVSGGEAIARSIVGFPVVDEDDVADKSSVTMRDVLFTASGGPIPSSGTGVRFAVLTDDNATVSNREVFAFAEFSSTISVLDGEIISIIKMKYSLT